MAELDMEKFLQDIYNKGCLMLSVSVGYQLGIFKFMCERDGPFSLTDVADGLGLKERYLQEWLSSMMLAEIIHQDRETKLYTVPEGHKEALLTSTAFSPFIELTCLRAQKVKKCFYKDGPWGVSMKETPEMYEWMDAFQRTTRDKTVKEEIMCLWEKQQGLMKKLEEGAAVLDIACGVGNHAIALAQRFPNSSFTGLDFSEKAIDLAKDLQQSSGVTNVEFVVGDAHHLPEKYTGQFDLVTMSGALHVLPDADKGLDEVYKVMKDDGVFSILEAGLRTDPFDNIGDPYAAMAYSVGMFTCLTASLVDPPHVGHGPTWGIEAIENTLKSHKFKLEGEGKIVVSKGKAYILCTK